MIYEGSRYQGGAVLTMPDKNGHYEVSVYRSTIGDTGRVQEVVLPDNVRLDILAFRAYRDETLWWVIADANPGILWFDELPAGTVLRVPSGPVR